MLAEYTTHTSREMISKLEREVSKEAIAKMLTSLVLKGKIRTAV